MGQQHGRVALVTGGALGLGRAISLRLAAEGAAVAIAYHAHAATETVATIEADGGVAFDMPLDVTDRAMVDGTIDAVVERLGRLDIVVNNAGGLLARVPIDEMTDEHWHRVMELNLASAFYVTRAAIRHMGQGGRIVNVSSLAAKNGGGPGASAYATAKAGLIGLTRAAAKELGGVGITVNAIAPGFIGDTPFHDTFSSIDAQQAMVAQSAVGRAGDPADIAGLVAYLASPDAGFVTGTVIDINGGSYFT